MAYICVDFDGTVTTHEFPKIGRPLEGAIETIKDLQKSGHQIILHTMRSDGQVHGDVLTQAVQYLADNGVSLFGINHNHTQKRWTNSPKIYAHLYIDDAALGVPLIWPEDGQRPYVNWKGVRELLVKEGFLPKEKEIENGMDG